MSLSKLTAAQAHVRPSRIEHFRRRAWTPRRVLKVDLPEIPEAETQLAGEFDDSPRSPVIRALRRVVGLTSDMTLLLLLSPFFAGWFLYRAARLLRHAPKPANKKR